MMLRRILRFLLSAAAAAVGLGLVLPVVILGLPFWTMTVLHRLGRRALERGRPATVRWQDLMVYEPEIGWRPRGDVDAWAAGSPSFHVRTDPDGWRGPATTIEDADVVVFGDSFAWGAGADEETFFANLPGAVRIKAIGANGYNMVQGLLWMRRYATRLRGRVVVWLVYYGNDLYENLQPNMGRYRIPFVRRRLQDGELEIATEHVSRRPWRLNARVDYTVRLAEICSPTPLSRRVFEACEHLIATAARLCAEAGATLVVVGNPDVDMIDPSRRLDIRQLAPDPDSYDPGRPDREMAAACRRHGVGFYSLADRLCGPDHLPEDCHWSVSGHRKVADLLAGLVSAGRKGKNGESPGNQLGSCWHPPVAWQESVNPGTAPALDT